MPVRSQEACDFHYLKLYLRDSGFTVIGGDYTDKTLQGC